MIALITTRHCSLCYGYQAMVKNILLFAFISGACRQTLIEYVVSLPGEFSVASGIMVIEQAAA